MWEIYDAVIDPIPESLIVDEFICGSGMTFVRSGDSLGICETVSGGLDGGVTDLKPGMPLKELARCLKSWNYTASSLGLAAVNCYYNAPERLAAAGYTVLPPSTHPFRNLSRRLENSSVILCGHIPYLECALPQSCDAAVITDSAPLMGDYPSGAVEYLPEGAKVIADATSLVRKQLERLLALAGQLYLVGPGIPLFSGLMELGVDVIYGFSAVDKASCRELVSVGAGADDMLSVMSPLILKGEKESDI